jgi:hypothetical protein
MRGERILDNRPGLIFLICLFYAVHMVEKYWVSIVEWRDRYFVSYAWTQNLPLDLMFFVCMTTACYLYYKDPTRYLWAGMSAAMWILTNSFLHILCVLLCREFCPGGVTATVVYVPGGLFFLGMWGRKGLLTLRNIAISFLLGGVLFMIVPTIAWPTFHAQIARLTHLVK